MSAMATKPHLGRSAGLVLPLFSLRSTRDAGIGEIGALAPLGRWLDRAGFRALQLLPVSTLPAGEASPYSALSAMAIDPVYITWTTWPTTRRPAATSGCRSPIRSRCGRHARRLGWTTPTSARRSSPP